MHQMTGMRYIFACFACLLRSLRLKLDFSIASLTYQAIMDFSGGIDVVRNKIKMFAQKKVTLPPGWDKIIILAEADRSVMVYFDRQCVQA